MFAYLFILLWKSLQDTMGLLEVQRRALWPAEVAPKDRQEVPAQTRVRPQVFSPLPPCSVASLCSQGWVQHSFLGQVLLNGKFSCVSHLNHNNKPASPVQNTSRVHTCSHGNSIQHVCTFPEISESFNQGNVVCFILLSLIFSLLPFKWMSCFHVMLRFLLIQP